MISISSKGISFSEWRMSLGGDKNIRRKPVRRKFMKKIWQKSLASMVSAALCLTAFVGCLTVNAATAYTGTITSKGATVAPTDAEATVKVTLASEALANTVAVQISSKYGALTAVKEVDTATEYYVDQDEIKLDEGKFFVHAKTNAADKGFATAELVLTFAKAANVEEKDYEINIKAFAGYDGATFNEDTIDYVAEKPIYITVKSATTEPVVDDALVIAGASLGYGTSSLQMTFRMRKTVIELAKYDHVNLEISAQKYDTTTFNLVDPTEIVVAKADMNTVGSFYTYVYSDIQLYELGLNLTYMLKAYDAEGTCVATSVVATTSPADYLKSLYESSSDELLLTVITDTLIVGNESKLAMQKAGSDLESAASVIEGFDLSKATPSVDSYNTVNTHNATDAAWGTESKCAHQARISTSIGKAPYLSYRIKGASSLDINKLSFTVSYTQTTGKGTTAEYSRTFTSADSAHLAVAGSFITFKFDQIGLLDGARDVTFVATYDGAEVFNSVYSVETYLGANTENATIGALATALLKLGVSCRALLA